MRRKCRWKILSEKFGSEVDECINIIFKKRLLCVGDDYGDDIELLIIIYSSYGFWFVNSKSDGDLF